MKQNVIPVAVVGVGALFADSVGADGFWRNILAGRDLIDDVPEGRWLVDDYFDADPSAPDKTYARRGAFLSKVAFDPVRYGIPPKIIEATDTSQLLALIVAQQVLDDASKGQFAEMDREKMSVILGVTSGQELMNDMANRLQRPVWVKALREMGLPEEQVQQACDRIADHYVPWQESTFPGLLGNVVAGRIANRFDLGGTNCVTDAACASALSALSMGLNELYVGDSDLVIAGGVDTFNDIFMYMCFSKTPALSPSGDCRPFSDAADGTMLGEGLAMFALKRLDDAERDGDEIYAVIRGVGSSSDGRSKSIYAPLSAGQAKALRRAYDNAGYGPETVELIEAHGTGTKAGDAAEFGGLRQVFDETGRQDRNWCALGSVKSQVGHCKAAAGSAGLFKVVMALHHKTLPPTIKVDRPNPNLDIDDSPFYLNTEARPWIRSSEHPRRAGVSAFGFGGSNFHVTVEEYTGSNRAAQVRAAASELVVLSAATPAELASGCDELLASLTDGAALDRVARDTQFGFSADNDARLAVVATDVDDLKRKLVQAADSLRTRAEAPLWLPTGLYYRNGAAQDTLGGTAFLFPGQGSQYVGMGATLAVELDPARQAWDEAADFPLDGGALHQVVFPPPAFDDAARDAQLSRLTATEWAQPAIGVCSRATLNVLRSLGLNPQAVAGHSYGELTALHAAGVLDTSSFHAVSAKRGSLMADAAKSTEGSMLAVAAPGARVAKLLEDASSEAVIANLNSPRQTVVSGPTEAIDAFETFLAESGVDCTRLNVATAFHSKVVAESVTPFTSFLQTIELSDAMVPVYANSTAGPYPAGDDARSLLANQIAEPVRFVDLVENMIDAGIKTFVEVGPSNVLSRLVDRIAGDEVVAIATDVRGRDAMTSLLHALGQLAALGAPLAFDALWNGKRVTSVEDEAPKMTVEIWGGNHGRPYPPPGGAVELPKPNPPRAENPSAPAPVTVSTMSGNRKDTNAQPTRAVAAASEAPRTVDATWVHAFQESQRQMADAHTAYQAAMAQSHTAFLQAVSASQAQLTAMITGGVAAPAPQLVMPTIAAPAHPQPAAPAPRPMAAPAPMAAPIAHVPAPAPMAAPPVVSAAPVLPPAPVPAPVMPSASVQDTEQLLLDIVADKTGYPIDMLEPQMQLEADLGIDSIKRVEILSALGEAAPWLPEIDGTQMASLSTLGQIVQFLETSIPAPKNGAAGHAEPATASDKPNGAAAAPPNGSLETVLLETVADKTGYPVDMLELQMQLEADLGIDSIKRVEILSAVHDVVPSMPEVDGNAMAKLNTLGEILDFMTDAIGGEKKKPLQMSA